MSWQEYVDTSLVGTGDLDQAAIFGADGKSLWASSTGFTVKPEEMLVISKCYQEPASLEELWGSGIHIGGAKYVTLKADDRSIYGKKGAEGIVLVKTQQAIIVAHYPEGKNPGTSANTVEKLADYLIGAGF